MCHRLIVPRSSLRTSSGDTQAPQTLSRLMMVGSRRLSLITHPSKSVGTCTSETCFPRCGVRILAMPTEQAVAEGEHLCPTDFHDATRCPHPTSFVAERDHALPTVDEFVRLE